MRMEIREIEIFIKDLQNYEDGKNFCRNHINGPNEFRSCFRINLQLRSNSERYRTRFSYRSFCQSFIIQDAD